MFLQKQRPLGYMAVTSQNQAMDLGPNHYLITLSYRNLIWRLYTPPKTHTHTHTYIAMHISIYTYIKPFSWKNNKSGNNYALSKEILVWKQSPIVVLLDFTDQLGPHICHQVSKMLIRSWKGSDRTGHWTEKSKGKPPDRHQLQLFTSSPKLEILEVGKSPGRSAQLGLR